MKNLSILLEDRPGALADLGEALGRAGVSLEGGGMFVVNGKGVANFLVADGSGGRKALEDAGMVVLREDDVLTLKLNQDEPGQLGKLLRRMADAGVNVVTQYSDHDHQLVLVVDRLEQAQDVSERWMAERSAAAKSAASATTIHWYGVQVAWTGNRGAGTATYAGYARDHTISAPQKAAISGSSDPAFRGDRTRYNPEELLVASASACHMLTYLHLCAVNKVVVLRYEDQCTGEMQVGGDGSGAFVRIDLRPEITVSREADVKLAEALHEQAHQICFIANSLKTPLHIHAKCKGSTNDC